MSLLYFWRGRLSFLPSLAQVHDGDELPRITSENANTTHNCQHANTTHNCQHANTTHNYRTRKQHTTT